jgi:hypothetical protein
VPLVDFPIPITNTSLPDNVAAYISEAERRVDRFLKADAAHVAGFVPSDFASVYRGLRAITENNLVAGPSFCEWGSGFGVAASLAAMLGFQAAGIEIDQRLVEAARTLAGDFDLSVEFVHGSFIPSGTESIVDDADADADFYWLVPEVDDAYDELGVDPDGFDLIFAYPWPGGEHVIESLFEQSAADQALLLTYNQHDTLRLQRRVWE